MKKHLYKFLLWISIIGVSLTQTSCVKDIIDGGTPLKPGEMQVSVSGSGQGTGLFYAKDGCQVTQGSSTYFIVATVKDQNNNDSLVIHILIPVKAAPYTINVSSDSTAVIDYCVTTQSGCITYRSKLNMGSAVIKITDISSTIQGTFSGTLQADSGPTSVSFSSGEFNASF